LVSFSYLFDSFFDVERPDLEDRFNFFVHGEKRLFAPVSLGIFTETNQLRLAVVWLVEWKKFDYFILFLIIANSITLAMTDWECVDKDGVLITEDCYRYRPPRFYEQQVMDEFECVPDEQSLFAYSDSAENRFVVEMDPIFTALFTVECLLKVIGMGFFLDTGSYLRDGWNWIDFIVVVVGLLPYIFGSGVDVSALRVLRALRPLKSLNSVPGMKTLVTSLLKSLPPLFNVLLLLLFIFTIFGILGVQFFAGALHGRCRMTEYPIKLAPGVEFPLSEDFLANVEQQRLSGTLEYCMNATKDDTTDQWFPTLCEEGDDCTYDNSPWTTRHECVWPIDQNSETRICSLNGIGTFTEEMCESNICGSNYDQFGFERFILPSGHHKAIMTSDLYVEDFLWGHAQFDNIWQAVLTIFQCISMEGWTDLMYMLMDAYGWWFPALYFFALSLFGSLFLLNLTLAVIAESFASATTVQVAEEKEEKIKVAFQEKILRESMRKASVMPLEDGDDAANLGPKRATLMELPKLPSKSVEMASRVVYHWFFETFITFCILLNTVVLSFDAEPELAFAPADTLELINDILSWVFVAETCLKLYAMGFRIWSKDNFNIFDGILVSFSLIEFAISLVATDNNECNVAGGGGAFTALRTFRLFRVVRAFKLARSWESLQRLILAIFQTLMEIGNFGVLLLLFMYIFALIGMQMFAFKYRFDDNGYTVSRFYEDEVIDAMNLNASQLCHINTEFYSFERPRANFDDLGSAMVTVFQILTGENWNSVMYEAWNCCGWSSLLYFVSLVIIGSFIVFNLLIAIMLQNFEGGGDDDEDEDDEDNEEEPAGMKGLARQGTGLARTLIRSATVRMSSHGDNNKANSSVMPDLEEDKSFREVDMGKDEVRDAVGPLEPKDDRIFAPPKTLPRRSIGGGDVIPDEEELKEMADDVIAQKHSSLWVFKPGNSLRTLCTDMVKHPYFDNVILLSIFISSVLLAIDNPLIDPECGFVGTLKTIDRVFVGIFIAEFTVKVVSKGFILHPGSYLRNSWNVLDFVIVVIGIFLEAAPSGQDVDDLRALRTLRALRALRPLRVISRNPGLKLVVNALFMAIPQMLSTMVVIMLFFLIFSIVGVNYFKGQFNQCAFPDISSDFTAAHQDLISSRGTHYYDNPDYYHALYANLSTSVIPDMDALECDFPTSKFMCEEFGGEWEPMIKQNFDNVGAGMLALFEMTSTEQWVDIMYAGVDAVAIDMHPQVDHERNWIFFFVLFMLFGWAFMVQLLVGVITDSFNEMKEKLGGSLFLTESQKEWVRMQEAMMQIQPKRRVKPPTELLAKYCFVVCQSSVFENFILGCIMLNTFLLSWNGFALEQQKRETIEVANSIFGYIFTVEAVIKLIALRQSYFNDSWNIFDFSIVIGTWLGRLVNLDGAASIVRTFRVARIMRIIKQAPSLRQIFNTVMKGLPSFLNIGGLFFLFLFIFAVAGVQLFAGVKFRDNMSVHANFQDFLTAFVTLFRATTGENWNGLMYDLADDSDCDAEGLQVIDETVCGYRQCSYHGLGVAAALPGQIGCVPLEGCGSYTFSIVYWLLFTFLITWTFLNVFIAAILDLYSDEKKSDEMKLTPSQYQEFVNLWTDYDEDATCFINWNELINLVMALEPPMGFDSSMTSRQDVQKTLAELNIPIYENDKVFFSDVAQSLGRRIVKEHASKIGEEFDLPKGHLIASKWEKRNTIFTGDLDQGEFKVNHYYAASAIFSSYKSLKLRRKFHETMTAKVSDPLFRERVAQEKGAASQAAINVGTPIDFSGSSSTKDIVAQQVNMVSGPLNPMSGAKQS
jgi:hypothetical protein